MKKEILRMIIPGNKIINDNSNNNYRSHIGKLQYLTNITTKMVNHEIDGPCNFIVPTKEEIAPYINKDGRYSLILEVWKCQQRFDVQNYSMTFKPLIDVLSHAGYWTDDYWKYLNPVIFNGGDFSVWKERAFRYPGDNLPYEIKRDWWQSEYADPLKDTLVRVIISDELKK